MLTFVVGGARSGKSAFAVKSAAECGAKVAFLATCEPLDDEMKMRVLLHQRSRSPSWQTFVETEDPVRVVRSVSAAVDAVIVDCLTLWVSNLLLKGVDERLIEERGGELARAAAAAPCRCIAVANEVGLGIVPETALGRRFRDVAGRVNQIAAEAADTVVFMVSGLPLQLKGNDGKNK